MWRALGTPACLSFPCLSPEHRVLVCIYVIRGKGAESCLSTAEGGYVGWGWAEEDSYFCPDLCLLYLVCFNQHRLLTILKVQ